MDVLSLDEFYSIFSREEFRLNVSSQWEKADAYIPNRTLDLFEMQTNSIQRRYPIRSFITIL